ncbi:enoyl-CoA hydratase-related protein [Pontibacterium granulatum]|uniref:enoyl-CoA hydratase-related protein n=1 Tax=Pontibacterium granulatum TaxID=2036029 RepID=UPI00249BB881|nr:enoyl-CoA hydratase-related protein [Pontibacterium granulatum]MDI3323956.1 enoyl-CoA hydratase-related protein [Pontibacterium granulatum]
MSALLHIERHESVLLITLDRPKANAIDSTTSLALYQAFADFEADPSLQVAILTGGGERFFSAGWDLNAAQEGEAVDADHGPGGFAGLTEFFSLTKPVIAAVNGMAVGGGFELALSCDMIVAADHAQFFLPEAQIGIAPDSGGVFRLPARLPRAIAMEMMLTGKRLDAKSAAHYGLVNRVVPPDQLLPTALELAASITRSAPLAQRAIKELVKVGESHPIDQAFQVQRSGTLPNYGQMLTSEDAREGGNAFAEGREPLWTGK